MIHGVVQSWDPPGQKHHSINGSNTCMQMISADVTLLQFKQGGTQLDSLYGS